MTQSSSGLAATVRLGLVGCGAIARLHAQRLLADPRARLVGLVDENRAAAERFRQELVPGSSVFDNVEHLLGVAALDGVVVCTPTRYHFDQVMACRRRGVHVLCEKPLADTRQRIVELIAESSSGGPLISVSYQRRYDPLYVTLRREVQSGRWGPVRSVTTHNSERWQQTIAGTWRDDPQINPGGFLGDAGSHKIDMLFYVTGLRPEAVFAHSDQCGSRVPIVTTISGKLSGGVALSMSFIGNAQHWREDFQVHCAEADLSIRENTLWIGRNNCFEKLTDLEPGGSPDLAFLDALTLGTPNQAPPECALPVFDFTQAILQSATMNRLTAFP
jgi:predicted dehydrogenase